MEFGWTGKATFERVDDLCPRCGINKAGRGRDRLCKQCKGEMDRLDILDLMKQGHG